VSPFATKCADRDGLALNKLLARAAQKDPGHQVLIAVQVENEMPCYQDYCPAANEHFGEQVPKALLDYLKANDTPKFDETKLGWFTYDRWHNYGHSGTAGNWSSWPRPESGWKLGFGATCIRSPIRPAFLADLT